MVQVLTQMGEVLVAFVVACGITNLAAALVLGHLDTRRPL